MADGGAHLYAKPARIAGLVKRCKPRGDPPGWQNKLPCPSPPQERPCSRTAAGVVVDTEVCLGAPDPLWWSGIGDLVAKTSRRAA